MLETRNRTKLTETLHWGHYLADNISSHVTQSFDFRKFISSLFHISATIYGTDCKPSLVWRSAVVSDCRVRQPHTVKDLWKCLVWPLVCSYICWRINVLLYPFSDWLRECMRQRQCIFGWYYRVKSWVFGYFHAVLAGKSIAFIFVRNGWWGLECCGNVTNCKRQWYWQNYNYRS